jgi:hypothetical protein
MEKFEGKWRMESSENFDKYMEAVGVGFMLRKVASTLKPDLIFVKDGDDKWKMRTESTFKTTEISFKLGEEFDEETADGRKVKTVMTLEDNKLVQSQKGDVDSTLTRELNDEDTLTLTCKAKDVESKRVYKKVKS